MQWISPACLILYTITSVLLLVYGLNTYWMIALYLIKRKEGESEDARTEANAEARFKNPETLPVVTTQLPIYNELNVAERIIRAVAAINYPKNRHQIQVLDDSDDETCERVDRLVAALKEEGFWIDALRRPSRTGFKAGALQHAMARSAGAFIAIFDSDFVPPPDFLRRALPHLWEASDVGLVQARWDHLNPRESLLTRAQSIGIDGHFVVEQIARSRNGLFMNFCGTAGVWRRAAIEDAGGWQHDTVTEDLDLSYRAQLRGWRFRYLPGLVVPAELPRTYGAFKSQQHRWAKGSIQTARKMLPHVWASGEPLIKKFQATVHLTHYTLHLLMALLALLVLPVLLHYRDGLALYRSIIFLGLLVPAALGPSLGYVVCQYYGRREDWGRRLMGLPFLLVVGFGISLSNAKAVLEGFFSRDTTFVRTPKAGGHGLKAYGVRGSKVPSFELLLSLYCGITLGVLALIGQFGLIPFMALYAFGFGVVGLNGIREARPQAL